jgi:hypothetical protein
MTRYKITQRSGALVRRQVRRELQKTGVSFTEDKGLLDSQFVITGLTQHQYTVLLAWFRDIADS